MLEGLMEEDGPEEPVELEVSRVVSDDTRGDPGRVGGLRVLGAAFGHRGGRQRRA